MLQRAHSLRALAAERAQICTHWSIAVKKKEDSGKEDPPSENKSLRVCMENVPGCVGKLIIYMVILSP